MKPTIIRIGNAAGFWGDNLDAPRITAELGELDYLTLEYLAELTLSILAHQRSKNPDAGFVSDVPLTVKSILPSLISKQRLRLVTNGGGMNPVGCAKATARVLMDAGQPKMKIAAVAGDDLLPNLDSLIQGGEAFKHFDHGNELGELRNQIASANAYMGSKGIVDALADGAQIVLTGRIADASLVVGPAVHEFGWAWDDWQQLGGATVAGHLIECGAQVTGGMYSDWNESIPLGNIGYPIAEVRDDGSCVITKPPGTGGTVNIGTVSEQLVYEIGDPAKYMTPDVVADFCNVKLEQQGKDKVLVTGGTGTAAPSTFKVSMAYYDGFTTSGMIVVTGKHAAAKARSAATAVKDKMLAAGVELAQYEYEILGAGDTLAGMDLWRGGADAAKEVVLRIAARDPSRQAIDRLTRELAPLVTSGPPGVTGYTNARARSRPVISYWPSTVLRENVSPTVEVRTAKEWLA